MKIKVSVIVPVWNVEKYIEKCLLSLVKQTLKEIEIIVVNDGSPDNSKSIIEKISKKYPEKIIYLEQKNDGQGSARNLGLSIAKGEYIGFVDGDDWVDLDMYEKMYFNATKNNMDIVVCDMSGDYKDSVVYLDCTNYKFIYEKTPSVCNKLFRKNIIKDFKFISKIWYEDLNFFTKVILNTNKISTISKDFYHCNCRDGSTMNNNNSLKNLDMIVVIDDIISYSKKNKLYNKDFISYLIFNHILISSINRVQKQTDSNKKAVIKKFVNYCRSNIKGYRVLPFYKNISIKRKIIAFLNYNYLSNVSCFLLALKDKNRKLK